MVITPEALRERLTHLEGLRRQTELRIAYIDGALEVTRYWLGYLTDEPTDNAGDLPPNGVDIAAREGDKPDG